MSSTETPLPTEIPDRRVLVLAAHPDDEVLGCGGTVVRLVREGCSVFIAILGEGITSRSASREESDHEAVEALKGQSQDVARALGAAELFMYALPDNRFDTVPLLEIVKIIEGLIDRIRPEIVYTHHGGDLNVDHAVVFRATLTATRPMADCPVKTIYAYEVPSATEWSLGRLAQPFHANVFVDISETLDAKLRAMSVYEGETRPFPHPRSPEALETTARRWGSVCGLQAAEAFELIRMIR